MTLALSEKSGITIRPGKAEFCAAIEGVDIRDLDDAGFATVEDAFNRYSAIVIRGQSLRPADLSRFGRRFGELETHTLKQYTLPEDDKIYVLANIEENGRQIGAHNEGIGWHTDLSYKQRPVMATILYGLICPPDGADTLIANTAADYDALPEADKQRYAGLKVHHSYHRFMAGRDDRAPLTEAQKALTPDVWHPLVRTHPVTGRKALYIGTGTVFGVTGMPDEDGVKMVADLVEYATQDRFVYRHSWREGDLLMWDNRSTLHTGTLFDDVRYKRHIHRMMVQGDAPF